MLEYIIGIGAVAIVVFTIVLAIVRKKKGKTSCGCDCAPKSSTGANCTGSCSGCMGCPKSTKKSDGDSSKNCCK